ncbi:hypothetical protein [Actinacidiphila yeochonensis]|uniref:hypothetical protein n=1 Tax=Actinacidiphila yeochonensis TaxID=89050 RepID=UPI0005620C8F|nr:hypothetical protein [Actinacidiphila yeochonensis]
MTAAEDTGGAGADGPRQPRITKPMLAGAAVLGCLLLASPFLISAVLGHHHGHTGAAPAPAGYNNADGGSGFVPGADPSTGGTAGTDGGTGGSLGKGGAHGTTSNATHGGTAHGGTAGGGGSTSAATSSASAPGGSSGTSTATSSGGGTAGSTTSSGPGATSAQAAGSSVQRSLATVAPTTAAPVTFSAVAGPYCPKATDYTWSWIGHYTDDQEGWTTHPGGYTGSGCTGKFTSMPMSGDGKDDENSFLYSFITGSVHTGTCSVKVWIPKDSNVAHVGGHPTLYTVHSAVKGGGTQLGAVSVSQVSHEAQWVSLGSFADTQGQLSVRVHTRGDDNASGYKNAHHALDALSVSCTT